ncbi:Hypothetical_protein [Hexamita inflata]|uniref:Hypothetical_protein n=1 Tax=Hexamita inflata TaxID=28002 RepID=A0AA86U921_9EUKA|nr:Hypothetical protein HINF_LOCUS35790 [Hexamita inflata]
MNTPTLKDVSSITTSLRQKIKIIALQHEAINNLIQENQNVVFENKRLKEELLDCQNRAHDDLLERDRTISKLIQKINVLEQKHQQITIQQVPKSSNDMNYLLDDMLAQLEAKNEKSRLPQFEEIQSQLETKSQKSSSKIESKQESKIIAEPKISQEPKTSESVKTKVEQSLQSVKRQIQIEREATPLSNAPVKQNKVCKIASLDKNILEVFKKASVSEGVEPGIIELLNIKQWSQAQLQTLLLPLSHIQSEYDNINCVDLVVNVFTENPELFIQVLQATPTCSCYTTTFQQLISMDYVQRKANEETRITQLIQQLVNCIADIDYGSNVNSMQISVGQVLQSFINPITESRGQVIECLIKQLFILQISEIFDVDSDQYMLNYINSLLSQYDTYLQKNLRFCALMEKYLIFFVQSGGQLSPDIISRLISVVMHLSAEQQFQSITRLTVELICSVNIFTPESIQVLKNAAQSDFVSTTNNIALLQINSKQYTDLLFYLISQISSQSHFDHFCTTFESISDPQLLLELAKLNLHFNSSVSGFVLFSKTFTACDNQLKQLFNPSVQIRSVQVYSARIPIQTRFQAVEGVENAFNEYIQEGENVNFIVWLVLILSMNAKLKNETVMNLKVCLNKILNDEDLIYAVLDIWGMLKQCGAEIFKALIVQKGLKINLEKFAVMMLQKDKSAELIEAVRESALYKQLGPESVLKQMIE